MNITEISLLTIASSLSILVLFLIGTLICIIKTASLIKKEVHGVVVKGKSTINNMKNLAVGSLNLIGQPSGKGRKRARKDEKAMNWVALGGHLFQLAHQFFKRPRSGKKRK